MKTKLEEIRDSLDNYIKEELEKVWVTEALKYSALKKNFVKLLIHWMR